jgi:hypothetical protein
MNSDALLGILILCGVVVVARYAKRLLVALKVEASIIGLKRIIAEVAILVVIAFFLGAFLTTAGIVREGAFVWLIIGLPVCVLLGRHWWRRYR